MSLTLVFPIVLFFPVSTWLPILELIISKKIFFSFREEVKLLMRKKIIISTAFEIFGVSLPDVAELRC